MPRGIAVVGLDCIAPYQPLRGFYCDLHINEHLSVCSRERFGWEQCSFSAARAYLSNKHVKHAGLCSKGSQHMALRVGMCTRVLQTPGESQLSGPVPRSMSSS